MANVNVGDAVLTLHQLRPGVVRPAFVWEIVDANTVHLLFFGEGGKSHLGMRCPIFNTRVLAETFMAGGANVCCYPKTA